MTHRLPTSLPTPFVIGLAGAVGSGKSTVADAFRSLGCEVLDADARARDIIDTPPIRSAIQRRFGPAAITPDGSVDRAHLADAVFNDPDARRDLEAMIHPLILAECRRVRHQASSLSRPAAVLDVPLLFETELDEVCDVIVFIDTPDHLRLRRVEQSRRWDDNELARRDAAQLDAAEKLAKSHAIINNDDAGDLHARVRELFDTLMSRVETPTKQTHLDDEGPSNAPPATTR